MKKRGALFLAEKTHYQWFFLSFLIALALIAPLSINAQKKTNAPKPVLRKAVKFDVSPPLRGIKPVVSPWDEDKGEDDRGEIGPINDTRHDPDPVLQKAEGRGVFNQQYLIPPTSISFDGLFNPAPSPFTTGPVPPDPNGDIGLNHYVQMVNSQFQIFNRNTGASVYGPANINTVFTGFGGACETENAGDPVVLYDQFADRWLLSQFTAAGPTYYNCVALSTTGDPTGTYYRYAFTTGANFPDYPKYGVWGDAYYISTREFAGNVFAGVGAYALNRAQMLAGNASPQVVSFITPPATTAYRVGDGLLPADADGSAPPPAGSPNYFVGTMDSGFASYGAPADALNLFKFQVDWAVPLNSAFTFVSQLNTAAFDSVFPCSGGSTPDRNCIPQPGTTVKIDALTVRQRPLFRLAYRNLGTHESLVTVQSVEAQTGIAGMRWYEIRNPNSSPVIYQQGTYSPDTVNRWMGSAAMDRQGNIAMAYNVSDASSVFPGIRYTGRLVADALGTMPQGEGTIINGTGSQTSTSSRWGDYSSLNLDPTDDCTFWYTSEYYSATTARGWKTRIGSFKFPGCAVYSIAGTFTYGTDTSKKVGNVLLSAANALPVSTNSAANGAYTLSNLTAGASYVAIPAKTNDVNGISSFDATLILRHVASGGSGPNALTGNQLLAADTNNSNSVTAFDATQVLRYVAANGSNASTGNAGTWKFSPASRSYPSLAGSIPNENYTAILIGEVNGSWTP